MITEPSNRLSRRGTTLLLSAALAAVAAGIVVYRVVVRRPALTPAAAPAADHEVLRVGALPVT